MSDPATGSGGADKTHTPGPRRLTVWEILNSQVVIWLFGSVVLSSVAYYWNHRNDQRAEAAKQLQQTLDRQREDSQFLGTMLPYLTSADANVRLRAVDVITARYPDGQVPGQIYVLLAKVVGTESALPSSHQSDEQKNLLASAARSLDRQAATDAASTAAVQQLPPRVYIQIFDEAQRAKAREIQADLQKEGLIVPGIENVASKAKPWKGTVVKFFNESDAPTANHIRERLVSSGFSQAAVQPVTTSAKVNPGTIEVWLGSPS
jgi:hypothetical protein